jgi:hypothetical protein
MGIQVSQGRIHSRPSSVYWILMEAQFTVVVAVGFTVMYSSQSVHHLFDEKISAAASVVRPVPVS